MFDFKEHLDRIAFIDRDEEYSYQRLLDESAKFSSYIKSRCLIFILCNNTAGAVVSYVAALQHKVVPLMLRESIEKTELDKLIEIYKPSFVLMDRHKLAQFNFDLELKGELLNFCILECAKQSYPLYADLALLLSTSGSTSSPKIVRLSYQNLMTNTQDIIASIALTEDDVTITTLPLYYTFGLSILNTYLTQGAKLVLTEYSIMQREFWQLCTKYEITSLSGVPYTYQMLYKLGFFRRNLPKLKVLTQAGGKLSSFLQEEFAKYAQSTGKRFYVMYGACEATARMSCLPYAFSLTKLGSMGKALNHGQFFLQDETGKIIDKPLVKGQLAYRGANVSLGYAHVKEDLNLGDENQGKLLTSDVAYFDEDGFYYIVGRKDRFLKIYGNRVSLDEVEALLKSAFPNQEFASAGIDDALYIFMVLANEKLQDDVRSYISHKLKLNLNAFHVVSLQSIPKNEAGKTSYGKLAEYYKS